MSTAALNEQYRSEQERLNRTAMRHLATVFPALNLKDIDRTAPGWVWSVEKVTAKHYADSRELATEFYAGSRTAAGVAGKVAFVLPELNGVKLRASLTYVGPYAAKQALGRGARIADVAQVIFGNTSGVAIRHGMAGARDTITRTAARDPQAIGWSRYTSAGACGFCRMLADRGAVYREATADFAAHDHCNCGVAPEFVGGPARPEASVMQYRASERSITDADRAQLRDYLNEFYPD